MYIHLKTVEISQDNDLDKNVRYDSSNLACSVRINANLIFFHAEEVSAPRLACVVNKALVENIFLFSNIVLPSLGLLYLNYRIYKVAKNQRKKIRNGSCTSSASQSCTDQNLDVAGTSQKPETSQNAERKEQLQQIKIVKTFAIILGVFISCLFPKS